MQETQAVLLRNNEGTDQHVLLRSLISAFVIRYLKNKVTGSHVSSFYILFCGLQLDKASGYAPDPFQFLGIFVSSSCICWATRSMHTWIQSGSEIQTIKNNTRPVSCLFEQNRSSLFPVAYK